MQAALGRRWLWVILALILFSLAIWFGGPYIAVADYAPLGSEGARIIAIALLIVLWGARAVWRELKAARAGRNLAKAVSRQEDPANARASADSRQMQERFDEAIEALQKSSKSRKSLYDLPWYIIIGPPGAGKTTAIVNSGLNFPLAQKFGKEALRGVGGTRNCDWWFTDQAILLDTAGRYTTQDSDQSSDSAGWLAFLALLRKYRRRRPINGVLVAMSIADLANQSEDERTRHVAAVRGRLAELNKELRIQLPVYVILTKGDLLAGFNEFFDDLQQDGRAQVWGTTFPLEASRSGQSVELFANELTELLERLNTRMLGRIEAERDVQRRGLIFGFPRQLAGARAALVDFISEAFASSAYDAGVLLRGVYITSGTQEGTPVDRMLGALARTFGLGVRAVNTQANRGKAYFLQRLLQEVIFKESGLAGVNRRIEVRQALLQAAVYLGIAAVAVLGVAALVVSYERNSDYLAGVATAVRPVQGLPAVAPADLLAELPRLDAYRDAVEAAGKYDKGVPFSMRAGLYQGNSLRAAAVDAYVRELNAGLAPAMANMLRERLAQLGGEPDKLYEYLKIYLMLGSPERLVPAEMRFITDREWQLRFPNDAATIERLQAHVAALIADKSRVQPLALDSGLISQARTSLRQASLPVLMYSRLKLSHAGDLEHAIHPDQQIGLGGAAVLVHRNGAPLLEPIPALYTRAVFNEVATTGKYAVADEFVGDSWVLGEGVASKADIPRLAADMMRLYEDDYIRVWDGFVADLGTRPTTGTKDLADVMALLASPGSPLKRMLVIVEANTNLLKPLDAADKAAGLKAAVAANVGKLEQMFAGAPSVEKPGTRTTLHFAELNKLVDGPAGGAPIDLTLRAIGQIQQQLAAMGGGLGDANALATISSQGQASAVEQLRIAAMQLPAPIASIVSQVGTRGESAARSAAGAELSRRYQTEVATECRQLITGRYPFSPKSNDDVALADFGRIFGPGGVFDSFFRDRLSPLVDTSTSPWHWKQGAAAIGGSNSLLTQFQDADRIRQIYFPPGAQLPSMHFSLTPEWLDSAVPRLAVDIDGQSLEYRHGPLRSQALAWPGPAPGEASVLFDESGGGGPNKSYRGPWAFFHLLDDATVQPQSDVRFLVTLAAGARTARVTLEATSVRNPFGRNELRSFRCGG